MLCRSSNMRIGFSGRKPLTIASEDKKRPASVLDAGRFFTVLQQDFNLHVRHHSSVDGLPVNFCTT